jgi:DNA-binding CsgD family transcriptional regulator
MQDHFDQPGEWLDISAPGTYRRLLELARRRLGGCEHHADDVVSRALAKWVTIPSRKRGVARIERVIMSEAYSLLRSESRLAERERRAALDRSLDTARAAASHELELVVLRRAMAQALQRQRLQITANDLEVLDYLWAGSSVAEIARSLGCSRHHVIQSREKWRRVVRIAGNMVAARDS